MSDVLSDGDGDRAFTALVEPYRQELHAHCYRMLGSVHDADDALQETLVKAWRGLDGFERRSSARTWLHAIATRVCLDAIRARGRRALPVDLGPSSEHPVLDAAAESPEARWLTPYPDGGDPADRRARRESVELAYVAALQRLPGNQRAALLLVTVLGFSVTEVAGMLDASPTSVHSALARARRTVDAIGPVFPQRPDARGAATAAAFAEALERGDADALVALLTADVTWSMPPLPHWYSGVDAVMEFAVAVPLTRCPSWRHRRLSANGQPAVAFYVGPSADAPHSAWSLTVLDLAEDARICAITSFLDPALFPAFGLPPTAQAA